ncbi:MULTISPECIES: GNAT family N-acetyltransferase [unclassified Streptomyces]|uniref:GNAT family N-acetyltransferase n=1 Tax=Streptomyces millisiae TaxID=3075542 RepID=A0ABU2M0U1_9ACTN|nr:GNAT family N-acetyltransferase [Streptomyces sp. DSM 44918]MDT0323431.1 GNAT family N-acetyltransferase [Streptomyces sp. DSM 44918]
MAYTIRRSCREDWREFRQLRLAALRDPVAPVAFFEPYEEALQLTRGEWERRAAGRGTVVFVGEQADGAWAGMVGVYREPRWAQVVGVYLLPEHRGTGLAARLMWAAIEWAGAREVRLRVHESNARAARFYASLGFQPTGTRDTDPDDPSFGAYEMVLRRAPR